MIDEADVRTLVATLEPHDMAHTLHMMPSMLVSTLITACNAARDRDYFRATMQAYGLDELQLGYITEYWWSRWHSATVQQFHNCSSTAHP